MSSRSKNFRRRAEEDDANGEEATTTTSTKPSSKDAAIKTKKQQPKGPKLLSFADEEDESPFRPPSSKPSSSDRIKSSSRLSKSSLSSSSSHKLASTKDRTSSSSSLPSNVQPQAGEYTKEKLRELQKNTRTLASSGSTQSEPVIVLKGLVKPDSLVEDRVNSREDEELEEEERLNDRRGSSFRKDKDDAENRLASMGIGKTRDSSGSLIPDQATINAIRAKRERLRQSRAAAPDYISLDGGSNHGAAEGLSDEEPEFQGRIALLGDKTDVAKKGVFESVDGRGGIEHDLGKDREFTVEDDEDEEEKIWEEEQFRKGLGKRIEDGTNKMSNSVPVVNQIVQQQPYVYPGSAYQVAPSAPVAPTIGGAVGASRSAEVMSISQQAEVATKAVQDNIRRLKESYGRAMSSIARTDENLSASLSNITDLEKSLSAAGVPGFCASILLLEYSTS